MGTRPSGVGEDFEGGTTDECCQAEGDGNAREATSQVVLDLMHTAYGYAKCVDAGCEAGSSCIGYEALRLASITHVQHILMTIAAKRSMDPPTDPRLASAPAMREVAEELFLVLKEMSLELKMKYAVMSGEAGQC